MHWAWEKGLAGDDYRDARDEAAGAGTLVHMMIETFLLGGDPNDVQGPPEQMDLAHQAYDGFRKWIDQTKLEIVGTEMSLISEKHLYGGTLDCIGRIGGTLILGDWKSSNRVYADYLSQLGGYGILYEENHPGERFGGAHLLRFGKEFADFHHHSWPRSVLEVGMESFLLMRKLYENDKTLRKAVG